MQAAGDDLALPRTVDDDGDAAARHGLDRRHAEVLAGPGALVLVLAVVAGGRDEPPHAVGEDLGAAARERPQARGLQLKEMAAALKVSPAYLSALGFVIVLFNFVPITYFFSKSHNF